MAIVMVVWLRRCIACDAAVRPLAPYVVIQMAPIYYRACTRTRILSILLCFLCVYLRRASRGGRGCEDLRHHGVLSILLMLSSPKFSAQPQIQAHVLPDFDTMYRN
jgi:hypothetical protein